MEKAVPVSGAMETVVSVLIQGKELANELSTKLHPASTSSEDCCVQLRKIMSCYDNALELLNRSSSLGNVQFESPNSAANGSPESAETEQSSKAHVPSKKRKSLPRWSEQVKVCSESGSYGQPDDGFNWRKYGQKDILGANHPRAYYRCTYQNTQGCLATKQVQQSDEDPSIFEVSYRGKHTCVRERSKIAKQKGEKKQAQIPKGNGGNTLSFCFPTTPVESEYLESKLFAGTVGVTTTTTAHYSPTFLSPATSDSLFSPTCPQSDFAEIMSNATPAMSFPFGNLDSDMDYYSLDFLNCRE